MSWFVLCTLPYISVAQMKWDKVTSGYGNLPRSVQLYRSNDSLNGRPFIAYYISARLRDRSIEFSTQTGDGKRYKPSDYYRQEDSPLVVVNGTFFSFQSNQNLNVVVSEGKLRAYNVSSLRIRQSDSFYYPTRSAIGITRKRRADVAWIFTDTAKRWAYAFQDNPIVAKGKNPDPSLGDLKAYEPWEWWKVYAAIGGGPVLLHQGEIRITNKEEQMFANGDHDLHPRTAMGYTRDGRLIILAIQGRFPGKAEGASLWDEAKILKDLGCEEALNLDGGGSSCMLVNGKESIKPSDKEGQRAVPAVFMIKRKRK